MNRVTLQDIFNAAWQAFIIEDRPPAQEFVGKDDEYASNYSCRYLTTDGRKCAVGLCIPDGHPFQNSRSTFDDLVEEDREKYEDLSESCVFDTSLYQKPAYLLREFQADLHDHLCLNGRWKYPVERRKEIYRGVANRFKLTIPGEESC